MLIAPDVNLLPQKRKVFKYNETLCAPQSKRHPAHRIYGSICSSKGFLFCDVIARRLRMKSIFIVNVIRYHTLIRRRLSLAAKP